MIEPKIINMQYRTFGRTGWQVSAVGYGMWGMAGWTGSESAEVNKALDKAVEMGCNFFDTAWGMQPPRFHQKIENGPLNRVTISGMFFQRNTLLNTQKRV